MARTDSFRHQHSELLKVVNELKSCLNIQELTSDSSKAVLVLAKLTGKLKVHLAMEDSSLYPSLVNSKDLKTKSVAQSFINEMSSIGKVYEEYSKKWTKSFIMEKPQDFIRETNNIFSALGSRITKEENELYPLADKAA